MLSKKIKTYFRLYWIRILVIVAASATLLIMVVLTVVGLYHFFTIDSYYRKVTFSSLPFTLFLYVIVGTITGVLHTFIWIYFMFGGGLSKLGQKRIKSAEVDVHWKDVIGMENIKEEVSEVIHLIKDQTHLKQVGDKIIKGVLLMGPPGCGKTYLAKAIATETGLPFLSAVGSEFVGIFIGLGASRLKGLFREARAQADMHGGCIIFVDEIDAIARPRMADAGFGGGIDHNATVNQFLAEMDGLRNVKDNIVVFAATNVAESELDPALTRAGRFDRKIYIDTPGLKEREDLFRFYLNKVPYDRQSVQVDKLARITVGDSPADIANMVREASLIALRSSTRMVGMRELYEARERIVLGLKTGAKLSDKDRTTAAYHEAGHVMIAYLLVPTQDVFKASIIPRRFAGGATWFGEREERKIPNKEELLGQIKIGLAGYAAEKIHFGLTSAGVGNDLEKVSILVDKMVTEWGMGLGGPSMVSKGSRPWDEVVAREKEDLINSCMREVTELLQRNKDILEKAANALLAKDELNFDELESIFKEYGKERLTEKQELEKKKEKDAIGWDDVIGLDEAKLEAKEIVTLIRDRAALKQVGGRSIRGLMLYGPPGCGKTYLASAIANEAGCAFLTSSGSEFVEMYVGVGASRIRRLFTEAREQSLAKGGCVIFIDEIDALGAKRGTTQSGGDREYNQTLNQLLAEMDGLKEKDSQYNIVVVGATNRLDMLDQALLRPGRFDRKIYIDLPTWEDRKKLLEYYLKSVTYNPSEIDIVKLSTVTQGLSPADIANLIREATLLAVRNSKEAIGQREIEEAFDRILMGVKRNIKRSPKQIRSVAIHEAGHNIALFFFCPKKHLLRLTIVSHGRTGGYSAGAEAGDWQGGTKSDLLGEIKECLGSYAAEKLVFGETTAGVDSDFKTALDIAFRMVWRWGMGVSAYVGNYGAQDFSVAPQIKELLDKDVQQILQVCLKETEELLARERKLLEALAAELVQKETLNSEELETFYQKHTKQRPPVPPDEKIE